MSAQSPRPIDRGVVEVDGRAIPLPSDPMTLLDLLRDHAGVRSAKDGCSPQGQCGCCTVLVDGTPRVACVTPARRAGGRVVTTLDGLPADRRDAWCDALAATGGTQCGFCTPGIVVRLEAAVASGHDVAEREVVDRQLLAHLCRCTGWQTIREAAVEIASGTDASRPARDTSAATARAELEGGAAQLVGRDVAAGRGGFAIDTAPPDALVAVPLADTDDPADPANWVLGPTVAAARDASGKVQGRRTTRDHTWPIPAPEGEFVATLRTTWTEPAALETDTAWCEPGGDPVGPLTNGGGFGAKLDSPVAAVARSLADREGVPVVAVWSREDTVRFGSKRPPLAAGVRSDGSGVAHVARAAGVAELVASVLPDWEIVEVDVPGPPTSVALRGAVVFELATLARAAERTPELGADVSASFADGVLRLRVDAGDPLDPVVLRSYVIGAAHAAWSMVTSEALTVDTDGTLLDLTVRSFGLARAVDTPEVEVEIVDGDGPPVSSQLAVMVAVADAVWSAAGRPDHWPIDAELASTLRAGGAE